jgi:acyl-CoA synthetase (AMP-forming)/AMP-acid ligase II
MSKQVPKVVSDGMKDMGMEYGFGTYSKHPVVYPYWVGEYTEREAVTEDGLQESTFLLTGFHRGTWSELLDKAEQIENYYNQVSGKTVITDNGSAVAVFYGNSLIVPTGDAELKSIQVNLNIKEWKVTV